MTPDHTTSTPDTPPAVRVMTDGGRDEPATKQANVHAKDVVTREVDGEDIEMLRVPISSTRTDREGDRFTKEALEGMADQIREEQPLMFQNHGLAGSWMDAIPYDQAETIGTHMDAEVRQEDDGEHVLDSFVNPDGTHPEGERMLKQVRDEKQAVKFSVGFKILNSDPIEDDAGNEIGAEFTRTDLMEDSKVGIPANRDATVTHEVGAKDATSDLPGYQKHPFMRMLQAVGGAPDESGVAVKDGPRRAAMKSAGSPIDDDGEPRDFRAEINDLKARVASLADAVKGDDPDDDASKGSCEGDDDCPDGEECVDGECQPVDDDDGEDSASHDPTEGEQSDINTGNTDLRERIAELEAELAEGTGDSKTADTSTEPTDPSDDDADGGETDADGDPEESTSGHETIFD